MHVPQVDKVDDAIERYAGDYETMIERLEAKYKDDGFFVGWEDDEGFSMAHAMGGIGVIVWAFMLCKRAPKQKKVTPGILETLASIGRQRHPGSDTVAAVAPEEADRVPMLERGVTLAFLRRVMGDILQLQLSDIDAGQFLNGVHTTSSAHGLAGVRPGAGWI